MDVLLHDAIGMPFTEDDEVIQTFAPETAQEALADRIGLRRAIGSAENFNACSDRNSPKRRPIFTIVVTDQEVWTFSEGSCLA
jgi:hypothetical protein